jgi:hypothetical protein
VLDPHGKEQQLLGRGVVLGRDQAVQPSPHTRRHHCHLGGANHHYSSVAHR